MSEKREMTAVEFLKGRKRMCDTYDFCVLCPFSAEEIGFPCGDYMWCHPEESVAVVQKWAEEHPQKTMLQDFFEKFPHLEKEADGTPTFCPVEFYRVDGMCGEEGVQRCVVCWNRPLEV